MKKFLLTLLGILLSLPAFALSFYYTHEGVTLKYTTLTENKVEVTQDNTNITGAIVIPSKVKNENNEYSVTAIGKYAFFGCTGLTSVTIPNSVTLIRNGAFQDCSGLTSVSIPNSVTAIWDYAFFGCTGLTSVTIPNSVIIIDKNVFECCSGLTSVTIPNSVTSIEWSAFGMCSGLTSVTIPNSVRSIGGHAFRGCSGLTSVSIGKSVTEIQNEAFVGCNGLTKAEFASVESMCKIKYHGTENNPLQFAHNLWIAGKEVKDLVIPDSVTSIGNSAFSGCSNLTSVTIPNSVTSIGLDAFADCNGLTKAEFASVESMCKIDYYNFYGNPLYYAHNLWIAGKEVKDLVIPDSVTSIKFGVFTGCSNMTSVTIPNSVTFIGKSAFYNCSGLKKLNLPNALSTINDYAFYECNSLTSVYYGANDPVWGESNIFGSNTYESATLYVTEKGITRAREINPWKNFKNIKTYDPAGVEEITADFDENAPYEVYNLNGVKVGDSTDALSAGLYIIRQGNRVKKISVK